MEYHPINENYLKNDFNIENFAHPKKDNDSRPLLNFNNKYGDLIKINESLKQTNNYSKLKKTFEYQKEKTILDENLIDIFQKIPNILVNFQNDFNKSLLKIKYNYDSQYGKVNTSSYLFNLHFLAFFDYIKNGDSISYIGVFLIFISFLIYILNILI